MNETVKLKDRVEFLFDHQPRIGKVVKINHQPGWTRRQLGIAYRGTTSWVWEEEVTKI